MPGILDIDSSHKEAVANRPNNFQTYHELRLKDGDTAFVNIVPSGKTEDIRLGSFYTHRISGISVKGKPFQADVLCRLRTNVDSKPDNPTLEDTCTYCDQGVNARQKFGFWVWVYCVLRNSQNTDKENPWEEFVLPAGQRVYKQTVNDYWIFAQGFGQKDYLWNQVKDIYNDSGALNKRTVRIRRTGSGRDDTSYSITILADEVEGLDVPLKVKELPEEGASWKLEDLASPIQFFMDKEDAFNNNTKAESLDDDDVDDGWKKPAAEQKSSGSSAFSTPLSDDEDTEDLF